jgi:hypothetical protein
MPFPAYIRAASLLALITFVFAAPTASRAQRITSKQQVISANPFGILLGVFNAEYERRVSPTGTAGLGGSFLTDSDLDYFNVDVFYRYYPSERPMDGWAFGIKAGVTSVSDFETYIGIGFDVNRSWLLGKNDGFYAGVGFGLKRLFGTPGEDEDPFGDVLKFIPTFRIVNIGIAF